MDDAHVLLLDERDNVLVVRKRISAGQSIIVDGVPVVIPQDVALGHKIARRAIAAGDKIMKYGAPIGRATQGIETGEHVHVHNIASDYTKTHV